jgi:hypothetical protein
MHTPVEELCQDISKRFYFAQGHVKIEEDL